MSIRTASLGAAAALMLTLLAPALAAAQAIATFDIDKLAFGRVGCFEACAIGPPNSMNLDSTDPFDPSFGPNGQDAPKRSTLTVRDYNAKIEYARGFTDLQLGKFREAENEFTNALDVQPGDMKNVPPDDEMKMLYMLGVARSGEGDLKGASQAFEKALKLDPLQIAVKREYAVTLARLGETEKAQAQVKALKMLSDVCDGACAQADDYKAALARVQAALSGTLSAPG